MTSQNPHSTLNLLIKTPGLLTTVQDLGRVGVQRDGIPAGGAMDPWALRLGNLLVGNDEGAAALEITLIGPAIDFDGPAIVAITGADFGATIGGVAIPPWHAVRVPKGAELRFGHPRVGCRAYVCVVGGIDVPPVFGSRSTYLPASFGGLEGRALRAGDVLHVGAPSKSAEAAVHRSHSHQGSHTSDEAADRVAVASWSVSHTMRPRYSDAPTVRLIDGAQTQSLAPGALHALYEGSFRASARSDRMGYRLEGVPLALSAPVELLSEGVAMGTVQLPPGGGPILLMADRQTTGGYPRIGEVATVDLPLAAQLKPGDHLRFRAVSLADAQRLYLARERDLDQARPGITLALSRGI